MKQSLKWRVFLGLGLTLLLTVFITGVIRAYTRGANDFSVFYEAWRLVLAGQGAKIYVESPDRFLYCPGFAWVLAPLALLPRAAALALWCASKLGVLFFLIHKFSSFWSCSLDQPQNQKTQQDRILSWGLCVWGIVGLSRPLLIDLEYGQVNLLILGTCVWGLGCHIQRASKPFSIWFSWILLGLIAAAKVFPLPLLFVPWFVTRGLSQRKLWSERVASMIGFLTGLLLPILSEGVEGTLRLLQGWQEALLSKGLPLESHNQSFSAFLYHYLSGYPTRVLSEGVTPLFFGVSLLSLQSISLLSLAWSLLMMGMLLGWIISGSNHSAWKWIAVAIGLMIVPSHLVWKPYFVMSIPLAVYLIQHTYESKSRFGLIILCLFFTGINFTGFDFLGHHWAASVEAASILLMIHLGMLTLGARSSLS